jgi:hypothetical protein
MQHRTVPHEKSEKVYTYGYAVAPAKEDSTSISLKWP